MKDLNETFLIYEPFNFIHTEGLCYSGCFRSGLSDYLLLGYDTAPVGNKATSGLETSEFDYQLAQRHVPE